MNLKKTMILEPLNFSQYPYHQIKLIYETPLL